MLFNLGIASEGELLALRVAIKTRIDQINELLDCPTSYRSDRVATWYVERENLIALRERLGK